MILTSYMTAPLWCNCLLVAQPDKYNGDPNVKVHYYRTLESAWEIKSAKDKTTHLLLIGRALELATVIQMDEILCSHKYYAVHRTDLKHVSSPYLWQWKASELPMSFNTANSQRINMSKSDRSNLHSSLPSTRFWEGTWSQSWLAVTAGCH